jgi:hypothetical protein
MICTINVTKGFEWKVNNNGELIDSLQRNNYRITGIMQLLTSPSPSYNEASVKHHILAAKKQLKESIR